MRRLDFAAPHRFDGREIARVDRSYGRRAVSKPTTVPMPAAIRSTWRMPFASTSPRCRSGMRSDMAIYRRLAAENASTYGRMPGMISDGAVGDERADDARGARHDVEEQRARPAVARRRAESRRRRPPAGISCAATASAVLIPSGTEDSTAVQMIAPSMKLWNASPMMTSGAVAACTVALVGVAVPQQHELLEDEEHEDAGEQRAEDRAPAASA